MTEHAMTDQLDVLDSVLDKTGQIVEGVSPGQLEQPTPCPGYNVAALTDHLVGWLNVFAESAAGGIPSTDPSMFHAQDPGAQFRTAAGRTIEAFRGQGTDRSLTLTGAELPGAAVVGMMLMEFMGHGWDLATATDQAVPYGDAEAQAALAFAQKMLKPEYRGPDKSFAAEVPVPDEASDVDKLMGFLGRKP
jgi:uncharacterized protein (TIGR03086 family)